MIRCCSHILFNALHTLYMYNKIDIKVVIGDQMTCKNIRGSKIWRQSEINSINKLSWVKEVPGTILSAQLCTCTCIYNCNIHVNGATCNKHTLQAISIFCGNACVSSSPCTGVHHLKSVHCVI